MYGAYTTYNGEEEARHDTPSSADLHVTIYYYKCMRLNVYENNYTRQYIPISGIVGKIIYLVCPPPIYHVQSSRNDYTS